DHPKPSVVENMAMIQPPPYRPTARRVAAFPEFRPWVWGSIRGKIANLLPILQEDAENESLACIDINRVQELWVIVLIKDFRRGDHGRLFIRVRAGILGDAHGLHRKAVQVKWMRGGRLVFHREFQQ